MRSISVFLRCALVPIVLATSVTGKEPGLSLRWKLLSDRLAVVTGSLYGTNQIIIRSEKGLVLIDTGISPEYAVELRRIVAKEFGRYDYLYVINTHHHWDHVQGNQVFANATIVGHDRCGPAMKAVYEENRGATRGMSDSAGETAPDPDVPPTRLLDRGTATSEPDGEESPIVSDNVLHSDDFIMTPPGMSFDDELRLDPGDMAIHLIAYGDAHTDNDILVLIPEDKALAVGDLFFKDALPDMSGAGSPDVARWIERLRWIIDNHELEHVISGHGAILTVSELNDILEYIESMWTGIGDAVKRGESLSDVRDMFDLNRMYPHLRKLNMRDSAGNSLHELNVDAIYRSAVQH